MCGNTVNGKILNVILRISSDLSVPWRQVLLYHKHQVIHRSDSVFDVFQRSDAVLALYRVLLRDICRLFYRSQSLVKPRVFWRLNFVAGRVQLMCDVLVLTLGFDKGQFRLRQLEFQLPYDLVPLCQLGVKVSLRLDRLQFTEFSVWAHQCRAGVTRWDHSLWRRKKQ